VPEKGSFILGIRSEELLPASPYDTVATVDPVGVKPSLHLLRSKAAKKHDIPHAIFFAKSVY
jgi:hypothetical protein